MVLTFICLRTARRIGVVMAVLLYNTCCLSQKTAEEYVKEGVREYSSGDYRESIALYSLGIGLNKKCSECYRLRAEAHIALQEFTEAREDFTSSIKYDKKNHGLYTARGDLNLNLKIIYATLADYRKVIKLDKKNPLAHFDLANAYYSFNDYSHASKKIGRASCRERV